MDQAQEIMHMNKLLEVEDLSFRLQLEDAVSFSHLSRSDVFCYLLKIVSWSFWLHQPFILFQGFSDTSLMVGEAAAVLRNYKRWTGEVLKREDLQEKALATKLLPIDYDLKSQVTNSLLSSPYSFLRI